MLRTSLLKIRPYLGETTHLVKSRLFLTGGTGFFGRSLLALLALLNEEGHEIEVTVLTRNVQRFLDREPAYREAPWLSFCVEDVRDFVGPGEKFDFLIHGATSPSEQDQPLDLFDTMVIGGKRVLDWAIRADVQRILLIGSGAQYGALPAGAEYFREDFNLACDSTKASSAYGEGKRAVETMAAIYRQVYGLEAVFARCFTFVGPGLPLAEYAIGNFIRDALSSERISVKGDGTALRSYLYSADLAVWLLVLLLRGEPGQAYNVGSDQEISIAELAGLVGRLLAPDKPITIQREPDPNILRNRYLPCIEKARQLGLAPWTPLDLAIRQTAEFALA
jgi:nucleoside-diphosphate-sugar epimerase